MILSSTLNAGCLVSPPKSFVWDRVVIYVNALGKIKEEDLSLGQVVGRVECRLARLFVQPYIGNQVAFV